MGNFENPKAAGNICITKTTNALNEMLKYIESFEYKPGDFLMIF